MRRGEPGTMDVPKSGRVRSVPLIDPAAAALEGLSRSVSGAFAPRVDAAERLSRVVSAETVSRNAEIFANRESQKAA